MKSDEVMEWVESLGRSRMEQRDHIVNLLNHATEDDMSSEDQDECFLGLKLIEAEEVELDEIELRELEVVSVSGTV